MNKLTGMGIGIFLVSTFCSGTPLEDFCSGPADAAKELREDWSRLREVRDFEDELSRLEEKFPSVSSGILVELFSVVKENLEASPEEIRVGVKGECLRRLTEKGVGV